MSIKPFGLLPSIAMIILSVGLVNHVLIAPLLLNDAKRDAWLSVIVSLAVIIPWTLIPFHGLLKKLERKRFDFWLKEYMPSFAAWFVMAYFLFVLFLIASETLIVTSSWTGTTYLPRTPTFIVSCVFLGLCLYAAYSGIRTIAFVSCILLPAVVLLGDFVMTANMPHKDYHYLLPLLENGFPAVAQSAIFCLTAFSELFTLLLFQHHLQKHKTFKRWHLLIIILFLGLLAIGPLMAAIAQFGPFEAEKLRYPAFSQWRLVSIGKYLEHVDFFAIFQWLSGALIRLSLSLYLIMEYSPIYRMKRKWIGIAVLAILLTVSAYYWIHHMIAYRLVVQMGFKVFGVTTMSIVIILYAVSFMKKRRGQHEPRRRSGSTDEKPV